MPAGQRLVAMPGNTLLEPTVTRAAALEAAVAYLREQGERGELTLSVAENGQEFELRGKGGKSVECRLRIVPEPTAAQRHAARPGAAVLGRPPVSGWTKVKVPPFFKAPDFTVREVLGTGKFQHEVVRKPLPDARNYCLVHVTAPPNSQVVRIDKLGKVDDAMYGARWHGSTHDFLFEKHRDAAPCEGADALYLGVAVGDGVLRCLFRKYV